MNEISIKEFKNKKKELECAIYDLLNDFEEETDCIITNIDIVRIPKFRDSKCQSIVINLRI